MDVKAFSLYKVYSLPSSHRDDPNLYSYIEPQKPFLLISSTKTVYSMLSNLDKCQELQPTTWLCKGISVTKRTTMPTCEVQLFFDSTRQIPDSCSIKNLYADIKLWHKVQPNQWLYVLSKPTTLRTLCRKSNDKEETVVDMGLIQLDEDCKAYTENVILEPEVISGTANLTNSIPSLKLSEDDCCVKLKQNISLDHIKMTPVKLHHLNLDELQYAQHKLHEIDETIQKQLNEPFIIKHSNWFTTTLATIGIGLSLIIIYKISRRMELFSLLTRLICCYKTDRQLAIADSKCLPCVQVFTHCFNKPEERHSEFNIQYDAELERLNYPSKGTPEQEAPHGSIRRSLRSNKSVASQDNQKHIKTIRK